MESRRTFWEEYKLNLREICLEAVPGFLAAATVALPLIALIVLGVWCLK
jgi:hypothetical protein